MTNLSLNLHRDGLNEEHVMTEYEQKFMGKGMNIHRVEVIVGEEALREYQQIRLDKYKVREASNESRRRSGIRNETESGTLRSVMIHPTHG